jgi:hypothetical protein
MRLTASDFMTYWRPSVCELRVFLHAKGEPGAEPGDFDEVMRRLGIRHEQEHLATLGPYLDLSSVLIDERVGRTLEAIANKVPVVYQPAFVVRHRIAGIDDHYRVAFSAFCPTMMRPKKAAPFTEDVKGAPPARKFKSVGKAGPPAEEDLGATWAVFEWLREKAPAASPAHA